jgi:uncharacterized tellurite resistance protein B-like protein
MGLFDKILGGQDKDSLALNPQEAFASILLVTIAADGYISDEEAQGFNTVINRRQLYRGMGGTPFSSMIDKLLGLLKRKGAPFLLSKAVEVLPQDLKETAFTVAVDMVFADGTVEQQEKELIESMKTSLGLSDELAMEIIEVISIKNRGWVQIF